MLIKRAILDRIVSGEIDLAFRRWKRPTVKSGGQLRTAVGELAIQDVSIVLMSSITNEDARRAGYESIQGLQAELSQRSGGDVFRISLRYQGDDRREQLRKDDDISDAECAEIVRRIKRIGKMAPVQDLSVTVLKWIEQWPERRAQDLADEIGLERPKLKNHVRKLKELGLTESMQTGYRLSARGRRVLLFARTMDAD
ncbi:ASCH domain-containing protein [Ruegeria sp. HKCCD8929]|uniref:ASCH domain-containing protein n=1 Tax=Ruegeria sp. HKCCD8929 TaxID=2683006 RepID=UPI00148985F8|nr:ASCH domain-containing protein [Ruegeria sp. HKCCD8929]